MKVGAWKAVHVLAGSIIETMLIDYLVETDYAARKSINLKNLKLFEIIKICQENGILSEKTSALSHVIREYRNLIHPEKTIRANETADENGATIAHALVKMVTGEISVVRKKTFGYTAEQIVTKIETDPSALSIITHLLKNTREPEIKRLLLKIIPQRYLELEDLNNQPDVEGYIPKGTFKRLANCYHLAFEVASDKTKRDIALEFIRVIKEESAEVVKTYKLVFFRGEDLQYFPSQEVHVVISYLLSQSPENRSASFIENITGIGKFLSDSEVEGFIDNIVQYFTDNSNESDNSNEINIKYYLEREYWSMSSEAKEATLSRLNNWMDFLTKRDDDSLAEKLTEIRDYIKIEPPLLPF